VITGATGSSYLVGNADAGDNLRVAVTAKDNSGSATATSTPTAVVPPSSGPTTYTNTALPAISGTPQVGQTLTASNGSWRPTSASFQYAWQLCQSGTCHRSTSSDASSSSYAVQSSDVGYTVEVQVAPAGNFYQSVDSKPTSTITPSSTPPPAPPPPPPTNPGSVAFDGRANNMTTLYSYETKPGDLSTLQQGQNANVWSCLCFNDNTISLVSDSTYGKAYKATEGYGDRSPWGGGLGNNASAGQLSIRQNNDLGQWDYYAVAVKVNSWADMGTEWATVVSLGYQTSQGDQIGLWLDASSGKPKWAIQQNTGYANNASGWAAGSVSYEQDFQPVVYGQWQDFVIGVKWATDNTGAVEVYGRTPGGSWQQVFEKTGEPTYLYGTTPNGTFAQNGSNWPTVIDKIGLYYGYSYTPSSFPSETVYESGLTRSSDLATAESTLP
jgi:hypothetical protein